jgi:glycosyltransferase involved in cell wall biosynthesis
MARIEGWVVRRHVPRSFKGIRRTVFVSDTDLRATQELVPDLVADVVSNGVDTRHFAPDDTPREAGLLVFTGVMDHPPNVDGALHLIRDILPLVAAERPGARVAVVGRQPSPALCELRSDRVEVTGAVDDLRPWLRRAGVYACSMRMGTGVKNKLLEALACGSPCVATPLACRGLDLTDGVNVVMAEGEQAFARAIVDLMDNPQRAAELGEAGRHHAENHLGWPAVGRQLETVLERAIGAPTVATRSVAA